MEAAHIAEMFPEPEPVTVEEIAHEYLRLGCENCNERTMELKRHHLNVFRRAFGRRAVADIKPLEIIAFLKTNPRWHAWHVRSVLANIKAMFNWAVSMELIPKHPARHIKKPPGSRRRSATADEVQAMMRNAPAPLRQFLLMLQRTGMRFSEVAGLKWGAVDFPNRLIILTHHKTKRVTLKDRTVPLTRVTEKLLRYLWRNCPMGMAERLREFCRTPRSADEVHALLAPHSIREIAVKVALRLAGIEVRRNDAAKNSWLYTVSGTPPVPGRWVYEISKRKRQTEDAGRYFDYVFRGFQNQPWKRESVHRWLNDFRRRGIIPFDCHLHGIRHLFVSTAIERGVPTRLVAALVGHSDIRTTEIYTHVDENTPLLRQAMEKASLRAPVSKHPRIRRRAAIVGTVNGGCVNGHASTR